MAKKPKKPWQIAVRAKLELLGIGYKELAERIGENPESIRQLMSKDNMPRLRGKVCDYLNIKIDDEEQIVS